MGQIVIAPFYGGIGPGRDHYALIMTLAWSDLFLLIRPFPYWVGASRFISHVLRSDASPL